MIIIYRRITVPIVLPDSSSSEKQFHTNGPYLNFSIFSLIKIFQLWSKTLLDFKSILLFPSRVVKWIPVFWEVSGRGRVWVQIARQKRKVLLTALPMAPAEKTQWNQWLTMRTKQEQKKANIQGKLLNMLTTNLLSHWF